MKPIFSVLINTRQTFQVLEKRDEGENNLMTNILFFLTSMPAGFLNSYDINKMIGGDYYVGLVVALIVSGLLGLFMWNFIFSFIIWGVGKIFQGKSTIKEIKLVLAYSLVPNLLHLFIGLIMIIPAIILNDKGLIGFKHPIAFYVLWIFTLRILIMGLTYFNKYSYGFSLLTVVIPIAIMQGFIYGLRFLLI